MRACVAIVGSGVAAGLAANLLAKDNEVSVFQVADTLASPIPQIVPRRLFFDNTTVDLDTEKQILQRSASPLQWVIWHQGSKQQKRGLISNDQYFIYEKGKLAKALLEMAPVHEHIYEEVQNIRELHEYQTVFDCRGAKAVAGDPDYEIKQVGDALTHCTYVIAAQVGGIDATSMQFWSQIGPSGRRRTYYLVPIGRSRVSFGCSTHPDDIIDQDELLAITTEKGFDIQKTDIYFSGEAEPRQTLAHTRLSNVHPIGDAYGLPCPLTEYGVLKALSQTMTMCNGTCLSHKQIIRPMTEEIDPHLPMELFI